MSKDMINIPQIYPNNPALNAVEEYERVFGELTFTTALMSEEEIVTNVKKAIASGTPIEEDHPEDVFI